MNHKLLWLVLGLVLALALTQVNPAQAASLSPATIMASVVPAPQVAPAASNDRGGCWDWTARYVCFDRDVTALHPGDDFYLRWRNRIGDAWNVIHIIYLFQSQYSTYERRCDLMCRDYWVTNYYANFRWGTVTKSVLINSADGRHVWLGQHWYKFTADSGIFGLLLQGSRDDSY